MAHVVSRLLAYDAGTAAGVIAGSLTESATIGTASDAISRLGLSAADQAAMISRITVAFAVTQLAFEAAALLLEIDTHESWSKLSEKPRGAHDANRFRSKP